MFSTRAGILSLIGTAALVPGVMAATPAAYFPFDGSPANRAASGAPLQSAAPLIYANGIVNRSIVLNESAQPPRSEKITVPDGTHPFAISFWFRPGDRKRYQILLSKAAVALPQRSWWIGYTPRTRKVDFLVGVAGENRQVQAFSRSTVSPFAWNHVIAVYDGRNIRISAMPENAALHHLLTETKVLGGTVRPTSLPVVVGGRHQDDKTRFRGELDELLMLDGTVSDDLINRLFLAGRSGHPARPLDALPPAPASRTVTFVRNGQAQAELAVKSATSVAATSPLTLAAGTGTAQTRPEIPYGDFQLDFRLRAPAGLDAEIMIGGDYYRLDGAKGVLTNTGNRLRPAYINPPVELKLPEGAAKGQPFTLQFTRRGEQLEVAADGRKLGGFPFPRDTVGAVTVRAGTHPLEILAWQGKADFIAVPERTEVYRADDGAAVYRIPALLRAANGDLLAFAEARRNDDHDIGNIDIVLRRSTDGGKTWLPIQLIYDEGGNEKVTCANPTPVLDRATGRILLLFQVCRKWGDGTYRVLLTTSDDHGKTWTEPRNVTAETTRPDWLACHPGPGHAIQLAAGRYRNRLVVPGWHAVKDAKVKGGRRFDSHVCYSDDHGRTWKVGGDISRDSDECMVAEGDHGSLVAAVRPAPYLPDSDRRRQSVSTDGGLTWSPVVLLPGFLAEICQGSIIRQPGRDGTGDRLLFCHPAAGNFSGGVRLRAGLALRDSRDNGKTWTLEQLISPGRASYSDLTVMPDGSIGGLFEGGQVGLLEKIYFVHLQTPARAK